MLDIVFGVIALLGLALGLLWLLGLPGDEDTEELAGFVTANWDEVQEPNRPALRPVTYRRIRPWRE